MVLRLEHPQKQSGKDWMGKSTMIVKRVTRLVALTGLYFILSSANDASEHIAYAIEADGQLHPAPPVDTAVNKPTVVECGVWLAPSTIPGAGLGMYAGRDFTRGEQLQQSGDLALPIVDIRAHTGNEEFQFNWDEYTWSAESLQMDGEGYHDINIASTGFGAAANCFLPLQNVDEWNPFPIDLGIHRSRDPGAGAFTIWANRTTTASKDIKAGSEFFVSYGDHWFVGRAYLGPIPLTEDLDKADALFDKYMEMRMAVHQRGVENETLVELWDTFVRSTPFNESRIIGAYNHSDRTELDRLQKRNLTEIRVEQSMRSTEWLAEHGTCGDHIRADVSTIRQAGRGAFATRNLPAGTLVSHLPLIHVGQRDVFRMWKLHGLKDGKPKPNRKKGLLTWQLLLNYCFGHNKSTLLLCPYGPMASYVNHNQTLANVKLQWSDPARGNHMPEFLESPIRRLDEEWSAKLAMDLVATNDIAEGEEVFLDYGDDFEEAWQHHVATWKPVEGAEDYVSANMLNSNKESPFPTEFEMIDRPNHNVELWCNNAFSNGRWKEHYKAGTLEKFLGDSPNNQIYPCDIVRREPDDDGNYMYTVVLFNEGERGSHELVSKIKDVPREAMQYYDRPYTSDFFLENAFRHHIGIPDEIFPKAWMNLAN